MQTNQYSLKWKIQLMESWLHINFKCKKLCTRWVSCALLQTSFSSKHGTLQLARAQQVVYIAPILVNREQSIFCSISRNFQSLIISAIKNPCSRLVIFLHLNRVNLITHRFSFFKYQTEHGGTYQLIGKPVT